MRTIFRVFTAGALCAVAAGPVLAQTPDTLPAPRPAGAPLGTVAPAGQDTTVAAADSATGPLRLVADLSDRTIAVMRGDAVVRTHRVAIGAAEHPTPQGTFQVRRLTWNPSWTPPDAAWARGKRARAPGDPRNPMGRVKIFFRQPDYYVHGTHNVDSLGKAESHGCVRMSNPEVIALARLVMEHGGERREPAWWRRVLNRATRTQEVTLSVPVTLEVRA